MIAFRLSKLSQRERVEAVLALVAVLAAICYWLVVKPVGDRFREMKANIVIEKERIRIDQRALSPSRREAIEGDYERYRSFLPKRSSAAKENAEMVSAIEGLAGKAGISLVGTKPRDARPTDFYEEYLVEIEVEGSLPNVVGFLYELHDSPSLLTVRKLSLSPKSKETASVVRGVLLIAKVAAL